MKLDRTYQRELLEELAACYPDRAAWAERVKSTDAETKTKYLANLAYLNEHGLVSSMDDSGLQFDLSSTPRITAKGMDVDLHGILTHDLH